MVVCRGGGVLWLCSECVCMMLVCVCVYVGGGGGGAVFRVCV